MRLVYLFENNVPQPGKSSGAPITDEQLASMDCQIKNLNINEILKNIKAPYYKEVLSDVQKNDYTWEVTQKVVEYAKYMMKNPQSLESLPPIIVINDKLQDGAHRISAIYLLKNHLDQSNPFWGNLKLKVKFCHSQDPKWVEWSKVK